MSWCTVNVAMVCSSLFWIDTEEKTKLKSGGLSTSHSQGRGLWKRPGWLGLPWFCSPHLNPGTTRVRIMKSLSEAPTAV